ncbi:hypothetical protein RQP46_004732 [Phenoliferia psychrophenolica]
MEVDAPNGGGGGGGRGGSGGRRGGRGSSFKNVTGGTPSSRSAPYTTQRGASQSHQPSAAPTTGKWTHDLFGDKSDLYSPQINLEAVALLTGRPALPTTSSSSSLRPFGALTPLPFSSSSPSSQSIPTPAPVSTTPKAAAANNTTVFSRFGIRGVSSELEREKAARAKALSDQSSAKRREALELRRKEHARLKVIADAEADGFVVQVDGLVFGTSAEDVQTAFGAGAIADGKPLKVQLVPATPQPSLAPPTGPLVTPPVPVGPRDPLANGVPNGPRGGNAPFRRPPAPAPAPAPVAPPPPAQRTMYADTIEAVDPRLSASAPSAAAAAPMDVDMAEIPTGPRVNNNRGGGGGRGRGGARGGFGGHQQQQQQQQPTLLARFGAAPPQAQKGGSLLARLG